VTNNDIQPGDRELRPSGRYEWEQIVRRARMAGVIPASGKIGANGRRTKGAMSPTTFKAVALTWATYANDKGREVRPGDAAVAVAAETTLDNARKVRRALVKLGLLGKVREATPYHAAEYRLTLPSDLLDSLEVLTPAQATLAAQKLRDAARGCPRGESGGPSNDPQLGGPVDHPTTPDESEPEDPDDTQLGGPVDHPATPDESERRTPTNSNWGVRWTPNWGVHRDTPPTMTAPITTTDHSDRALDLTVTVPSAPAPHEDRILSEVGGTPRPSTPAASDGRCGTHPVLPGGERPDGLPRCPSCRAALRSASRPWEPRPDTIRIGPPAQARPALRLVQGGAA
jgi:hypothetical protein